LLPLAGFFLATPVDEIIVGTSVGAISGLSVRAAPAVIREIGKRAGPIVRTGPTKGKVRARNKDGRWREKRPDAGKRRE
jgi:hypothetical protein